MNRFHTIAITAALALAACKDKSASPSPAASAAPKPAAASAAAPAAGTTGEARTLTIKGFTVDLQVPKGWTETPFGEGLQFTAPGKSYYPSTMLVTPSCQGNCATVAANVAGFVETQKAMHESGGYTVEVKAQGELPGGGRTFHLVVSRDGEDMNQVVAIRHQDGWEAAVTCTATLRAAQQADVAVFAAWCADMKVTKS